MNYKIPEDEVENVLALFWEILVNLESKVGRSGGVLDKMLLSSAYNLLNRIDFTNLRPRFEKENNINE